MNQHNNANFEFTLESNQFVKFCSDLNIRFETFTQVLLSRAIFDCQMQGCILTKGVPKAFRDVSDDALEFRSAQWVSETIFEGHCLTVQQQTLCLKM